jgi:lipopolysaccharide heptosyltransferase II
MSGLPAEITVIAIRAPGGPEMLVPRQQAMPPLADGEVLVKVAAAGVNRPDVMQRMGLYPPPPGATEIPGLEIAGEVVALAPGAVGPSKRWTYFPELAQKLTAEGFAIWVLGSPAEAPLAAEIVSAAGPAARDLTSNDLRNAILALKCAGACVSNDSGLVHVAAAIGTPTIGIFGPTSPWHWAPLNPIAAAVQTTTELDCQPCHKPTCRMQHHRCMRDISAEQVLEATRCALGTARNT